jgi:hypothetical protein
MKRTLVRLVALSSAALVAWSGVAYAGTDVDSGDVGIVGDAGVSPSGATMVRGGSTTFDLTVTMDDGNLNSNQCANVGVTAPGTFTVNAALATSGSTTLDFVCPWQVNTQGTQSITFTNRTLAAGTSAPLGRSNYDITFGTGNMVTSEAQVTFAVTTAPKLYLTVNPRPASTFTATAGDTEVDLAWALSADDADITDYEVSVTGGKTATVTAAKGATTLTDSGLTNGTEYCYQIRARYSDGTNSFYSSYAPAAPTCVTPQSSGANYTASFKQPIDGSFINIAKLGRVIPVKAELLGDDTPQSEIEDGEGPVSVQTIQLGCDSGDPMDAVESYAAGSSNLGNQFRWDATGGFWIYNLDTGKITNAGANRCFEVRVFLGGTANTNNLVTGGTLVGSFQIKLTK